MSEVLIQYVRSGRHEAAEALRRQFVAAGFDNIHVGYGEQDAVVLPSGTRMTWHDAALYLQGLDRAVPIEFVALPYGVDLPMPAYETAQAAGMDLRAAIKAGADIYLQPGKRVLVPTGFNVAIPAGYELQVRSRSGLAAKHGVFVLNAPGTIDADYRGEIKVILFNAGEEPFPIQRGDRIAQAVVSPVIQARWVEVETLSPTRRGEGGFGSTGQA
ncbi:dUTP pyrophosphatase [Brevundimonas phage vB_BpoS-Marchewka]|uniref:dUTP diphosphatase n=1 Tax=Brevundimonas phage vB_BpoS-Marchewka TaxID=2948604 RepID=A0A9E7STF0_9CAUD|nr:dUTP pyrophosphatase [Brevundimonas phage vB_BpoS-Marchewka]UTC29470.1 dUTP pyrophosphatase [Brevundimonas phage vB_BpoS-Bambus]